MVSKKYLLTLALMVVSVITFAQASDWSFPWNDSSKVPTAKMSQYNQFLSNEYPYPVKPRNQWELGINGGHALIVGDIPLTLSSANSRGVYDGGYVIGASLRKALGHVVSLRGGLSYASVIIPYYMNTAAVSKISKDANSTFSLSLDALFSLNTISHYRGNPKGNFYLLGGYSLVFTTVDKTNPSGNVGGLPGNTFTGVSLNSAISGSVNNAGNQIKATYHALDAGVGYAFKLNDRWNLGIEEKILIPVPGVDYLDGVVGGRSNDLINYATIRLNYNIGNKAKSVQPLWWINPYNYVYSELNAPKHMKLPKVVLPDADGDGVTDQFDLEPNTPAGAEVDSHGRAIDTDGDGVPDYRDKEKLTPQKCFPVDADGVGTCPEPACCTELRDKIANLKLAPEHTCSLANLPSVQFGSGSVKLTKAATKLLDATAASIKANPDCKVKVVGHPAASKAAQQLAYDRVATVIKYLVTKQGIAEDRFIFSYDGGAGDANTIDLLGTTEEGPNTVPAPHPNLRKH